MARAPSAPIRVGGTTIAPAASGVLVTAIAVAIGFSVVVAGVGRIAPPVGGVAGGGAVGGSIHSARVAEPSGGSSPAGIPDVPWLADRGDGVWLYGRGAKARVLPAGEYGLAIDDRYVATTTPGADGRSTVHLRATATGAPVRDIQAPIWVSAAAWTPRGLVATGYGDASMSTDGGLVLMTPNGSAAALVPAGPFPAALGSPVARGDVVVSQSRRVAASNVCGVKLCDSQVVDLARNATFRPARSAEGFLRAVTDDAVVTTDGDGRWISARGFEDGLERWRRTDSILLDPLATAGGAIVGVVGSKATGWGVDRIDSGGNARRLTPRIGGDGAWPRIWRQLSTPVVVVVSHASFDEAIGSTDGVDLDVVGIEPASPASSAGRFVLSVGPEAAR